MIQQQGDAGLDNTSKLLGNRLAHNSCIWMFAIEHRGEHYAQLVVCDRANNLVPPDSWANAVIAPSLSSADSGKVPQNPQTPRNKAGQEKGKPVTD